MKPNSPQKSSPFSLLVSSGSLPAESLEAAGQTAAANNLPLSQVLTREYGLSRAVLLQALADYYKCPFVEYDERLPIPPELLTTGISTDKLRAEGWFPIIKEKDGSIVIACTNPAAPDLPAQVETYFGSEPYVFQ
ncbi:hypothetical protein MNBD_DELTA03-69, partial [hydrothermal vent metagenome]